MTLLRGLLLAPFVGLIALGLLMAYAAWSVVDFVMLLTEPDEKWTN